MESFGNYCDIGKLHESEHDGWLMAIEYFFFGTKCANRAVGHSCYSVLPRTLSVFFIQLQNRVPSALITSVDMSLNDTVCVII